MVRFLIRTLQRLAIFGLGALSIWLIVFVVFDFADQELPWMLALSATYAAAAYVILPYTVRMRLKLLQRQRVPSFTIAADGLPADPVNLALIGTLAQLRAAFASIGWVAADPLNVASGWRMVRAFVLNRAYPTAPFSTLYLFGRGQDVGFQKAVGDSPRRRHHVRFWAKPLTAANESDVDMATFWLNTDRPPEDARVLWVGAGTRDTGIGLASMTFQITHATDSDANAERNYIIDALSKSAVIGDVTLAGTGDRIGHVNHYITDGEVAVAELETKAAAVSPASLPSRP